MNTTAFPTVEPVEAIKTPPTPAEAARIVAMSYFPVPIPRGEKSPSTPDWQRRRDTADTDFASEYPADSNIGIILGPSKLVDADLDSAVALQLVDAFLPNSTMVWGRASKPRSHRAYRIASGKVAHRKYTDLADHVLLERRTGNNQTVIPPSTHPSGEAVEWVAPGPASGVDGKKISEAFDDFGAACLIASIWTEGIRQELALYITGYLLKAGCSPDRVQRVLYPVVENYDDPDDLQKRREAVEQTIAKYEHDPGAVAGVKKLRELLGEDRARKLIGCLAKWLGLRRVSDDDRPIINTLDCGLDVVGDLAFDALVGANEVDGQPVIFQFDRLVRVRVDGTGWPVVEALSNDALRGRLARVATWIGGSIFMPTEIGPPDVVVRNVQSRLEGWPGVPVLRRVVQFPFFTPDGALSTTQGYQSESMIWLHAPGCAVPEIPACPSDAQLAVAKMWLDELLVDFPFESDSSKAHVIAMMLLPFGARAHRRPNTITHADGANATNGEEPTERARQRNPHWAGTAALDATANGRRVAEIPDGDDPERRLARRPRQHQHQAGLGGPGRAADVEGSH
jgi:Bifunctional DNA primase/polymerase, N-terminal